MNGGSGKYYRLKVIALILNTGGISFETALCLKKLTKVWMYRYCKTNNRDYHPQPSKLAIPETTTMRPPDNYLFPSQSPPPPQRKKLEEGYYQDIFFKKQYIVYFIGDV